MPLPVTDARTVRQSVAELRPLADLGADPAAAERVIGPVVDAVAEAEQAGLARPVDSRFLPDLG